MSCLDRLKTREVCDALSSKLRYADQRAGVMLEVPYAGRLTRVGSGSGRRMYPHRDSNRTTLEFAMSIRRVLQEVRRTVLPTARIRLLDQQFIVPASSRGAWEEEDFPLLRELARGRRCVFDVGAYRGFTALIMRSVMSPRGELWGFEPSPDACTALREAAALQGWSDSLRVLEAFVSDRSGRVVEFEHAGASVWNSGVQRRQRNATIQYKPTISLDDFAAARGLRPDLVKIDVEGAEMEVIEGMTRILSEHRPVLFVEIHETGNLTVAEHAHALANRLEAGGYRLTWVRTGEDVREATELPSVRSRCHALATPLEARVPQLLEAGRSA